MLDSIVKLFELLHNLNSTQDDRAKHGIFIFMSAIAAHSDKLCQIWEQSIADVRKLKTDHLIFSLKESNQKFVEMSWDTYGSKFYGSNQSRKNSNHSDMIDSTLSELDSFTSLPSIKYFVDNHQMIASGKTLKSFPEKVLDLRSSRDEIVELFTQVISQLEKAYALKEDSIVQHLELDHLEDKLTELKKNNAVIQSQLLAYRAQVGLSEL